MKNEDNYLYVHIPFCTEICSYCDFCKVFYNKEYVDKYLIELEKELKLKDNNNKYKTIYIGGGTPSSLTCEQLDKLFNILNKLNKCDIYEYTIECNPKLDINKIKLFKKYGINRVSIGVQTFDDNNIKLLDRNHNKSDVIKTINNLNKFGIYNINIDMMFSIPNQNINSLYNDLNILSKLNIKHISYYSLILEENTKLYINKYKNVDEDIEYEMYNIICKYLNDIGFNQYETSNFSKEGYESIHNKNYWNNGSYLAIGAGACQKNNNEIINNTKSISKYINGSYLLNKEKLSNIDKYINELMLGLRLIKGINKKNFKNKYNIDIYDVFKLDKEIRNNRLIDDGNNIYINNKYIYVSNDIIVNILMEGVLDG